MRINDTNSFRFFAVPAECAQYDVHVNFFLRPQPSACSDALDSLVFQRIAGKEVLLPVLQGIMIVWENKQEACGDYTDLPACGIEGEQAYLRIKKNSTITESLNRQTSECTVYIIIYRGNYQYWDIEANKE